MTDHPTPKRPTRTEDLRVRVSEAEKTWLENRARDEDRSVSQVVRLALRHYMEANS